MAALLIALTMSVSNTITPTITPTVTHPFLPAFDDGVTVVGRFLPQPVQTDAHPALSRPQLGHCLDAGGGTDPVLPGDADVVRDFPQEEQRVAQYWL